MKDRLIELIKKTVIPYFAEMIADDLIADGWIRPPCKVGDKIYIAAEVTKKIVECTVIGCWMCEGNCTVITDCGTIYNLSFDKTVFLTREEAEQALRKEDEGK